MALNPQLSSSFGDHILAYIEKMFLSRLVKQLHLAPLGKSKVLPQNQGQTIKWNRLSNLAANVTPLGEGVTPSGQNVSSTPVTATLYQFGGFVTIADWFKMIEVNDTMREVVDILSYQASLTIDSLVRNELDANGSQKYTGAYTSKADVQTNTQQMATSDLKKLLKNARVNDVPPFEDNLLRMVIHPYMEFSLLNETGASDYIVASSSNGSATEILDKGVIGDAFGIRLLRSSNIRADAVSTSVYGNILVGKDAFGTVDLASAGVKIIRKDFGAAGTEDPLDQRATVGYKFVYGTKLLEAARCQVLWAYGA